MTQAQTSILVWVVATSIIVPFIVRKLRIKDDIKNKGVLPIGTAEFKGVLVLIACVVTIVLLLGTIGMLIG